MVKWEWEEKDSKETWLVEKCMGMKEYKYWKKKQNTFSPSSRFEDVKAASNASKHHTSLLLAPHEPYVVYPTVAAGWLGGGRQIYVDRLQTPRIQAEAAAAATGELVLIRPLLPKGTHRNAKYPLRQKEGDNTRPANNMADMMLLPVHWWGSIAKVPYSAAILKWCRKMPRTSVYQLVHMTAH
jgi:hypothetical protein